MGSPEKGGNDRKKIIIGEAPHAGFNAFLSVDRRRPVSGRRRPSLTTDEEVARRRPYDRRGGPTLSVRRDPEDLRPLCLWVVLGHLLTSVNEREGTTCFLWRIGVIRACQTIEGRDKFGSYL